MTTGRINQVFLFHFGRPPPQRETVPVNSFFLFRVKTRKRKGTRESDARDVSRHPPISPISYDISFI